MKNCEYYEELIGAALDGEITAEEEKELRAHLENCETCRDFYEAMQAIAGADDALGEPPEDFTANVMARIHETAAASVPEKKPAKKKMNITRLVTRYGALAAAAAVAIWAGATFAGTFAAKNADSASGTAPEVAMYSAAEDAAEAEKAARDAAPAEAPASGMMMAAAPVNDGETGEGAATVTIVPAKDSSEDGVFLTDDGFFAGYLLLDEGETDAPERDCDYTITLTAPDGTESIYDLWVGETIIWRAGGENEAHLSPAAPEALNEYISTN